MEHNKSFKFAHKSGARSGPLTQSLELKENKMVIVKKSEFSQLTKFCKMNIQHHVKNHLSAKSLETHQLEFESNNVVYLSVFNGSNHLAGYIILVKKKHENVNKRGR